MADPTKYTPSYDFSAYQAVTPNKPLPGVRVDAELADIAEAIDGAVGAIKDIRRSDGALKNGIVTEESLSAGLMDGLVDGAITIAQDAAAAAAVSQTSAAASASAALTAQMAAAASATSAATSAANALTYDPTKRFPTVGALLGSAVPAGGEGMVWQGGDLTLWEAAAGATDHHYTTSPGGVKLYEAGFCYTTRARFVEAVAAGRVGARIGDVVEAGGRRWEFMGAPYIAGPTGLANWRLRGDNTVQSGNHALMRDIRAAGGIVRLPSANPTAPFLLDDANHRPVNMTGVSLVPVGETNGGTLKLTFTEPGYVNGSHISMTDERYAGQGVLLGQKGFADGPMIFGFRPLAFSINLASLAVTPHPYFAGLITAADNGDGSVTITHPSIGQATSNPAIIETFNNGYDTRITAADAVSMRVQNFVPLGGEIYSSGANLLYRGPCRDKPTATFNSATGEITVTLSQSLTLPTDFRFPVMLTLHRVGAFLTNPVWSGNASFTVRMENPDGTPVTALAHTLNGVARTTVIDFVIPSWGVPSDVRAGVIRVQRGMAQFPWSNAANDTANIFTQSIIPVSE